MPFTPLHMGPGLAIKALAGQHFSLLAFGVAQVAMDIEPLIGIIRGAEVLHGPTHTYLAALIIAVMVSLLSPLIGPPIVHRWNQELSFHRLNWLAEPALLTQFSSRSIPVVAGATVGTLSHVMLDSMMHSDLSPFSPWSNTNGLLGLISIEALHQLCIFTGLLGAAGWLLAGWRKRS